MAEDNFNTTPNPLNDWLDSMSSEGSLAAEGSFSIAQEKAWEKLGAFQLPFEGAWVLKLVQAAVAGGMESISVVQTRSETTLHFVGVTNWSWQSVQNLLFQVESGSDPALGYLAVALRALAKSTEAPFFVNFPEDSMVVWDGKAFTTSQSDSSEFEIKISHLASSGFFRTLNFMTSIQKALTDHCHVCPIPLRIDNRLINSLAADPLCKPSRDCLRLGVLVTPPSKNLPSFPLPETDWAAYHPEGVRPALSQETPSIEVGDSCGAALMVTGFRRLLLGEETHYRSYEKSSELIWIRDGVVVSRESLEMRHRVAVLAILSADSLDTDLTGFKLRQNDSCANRRKWALNALGRTLRDTRREAKVSTTGRSSIKSLLGWSGIALTAFVPPAGLALLGMRSFSISRAQARLAREFDSDLGKIQTALLKT